MSTLVDPDDDYPNRRRSRSGDQLAEIQIAILAATMNCTQPVGAYQIVKGLQRSVDGGCMYPQSRVFREIKRLVGPGYLDATEVETSRGTQTRYLPTPRAASAVHEWLRTP